MNAQLQAANSFLPPILDHPQMANHRYTKRCRGRCPSAPPNTADLQLKAQHYFINGLAANTRITYNAGQQRFQTFCQAIKACILPASETTLSLFITYLATEKISHKTIKVNLSAIRHMHVAAGMCSQFSRQLTPRLQLTLKGIQRSQAISHSPRLRLPITLQLLQKIHAQLSKQPHHYNNILTWAACCLAFFGFLRVSEFTTPSDTQYDEDCHLSINDISLDSRDNPQLVKVTLKQSKTDPFRKGVDLYLGKTGATICPVRGLLPYLALHGHHRGPLFILEDGRYLTRQRLCSILHSLLTTLQIETQKYNTHSFRVGAATTARQANIPDPLIQLMGRWKSSAYLTYIKTSPADLAKLSKRLITNDRDPDTTEPTQAQPSY